LMIIVTFEQGTNPDIAQVQVQNKLQLAMPLLPQEVQRQGITVAKSSSGFLQVLAFVSEDGSMDATDIADYIGSAVLDPLSRVPGVGNIQVFGGKYAMRIWLDPNKLQTYKLSVDEVVAAVKAQNAQVAVGQLGGTPAMPGQQLNATINAQDRLQTAEQFRAIVVRAGEGAQQLRLGDIARVEMGAETYDFVTRFNAQPASGMAITLATGSNALATADGVAAALKELEPNFPAGLKAVLAYDTTPFVKVSIKGVVHTLVEAIVLVFLVMYLFLQNFRATLIPTIAVPVVLLGTFGVLAVLGFSINMLTMFAMVLAIGLLVDDAIVVVENVERIMVEERLSPLEATRKSMTQITGALVGIGLVLSAVFVPMAFMSGSTGVIYRQFSATIVSAMALSVVVAIVLTPALCATLLKPLPPGEHHVKHTGVLGRFFGWFNNTFDKSSGKYQRGVRGILNRPVRFMMVFGALVLVMALMFVRLPSSFVPAEDQGILMSLINAPVGATQERTLESIYKLEKHFLENEAEAVDSVFSVQGFSFQGLGQNSGMAFIKLKEWDKREEKDGVGPIAGRAMGALGQIKDAFIFAFPPPAIIELGIGTGYTFFLKDNTGQGHEALLNARNQLLGMAAQSDKLANVRPNGLEDTPQLRVDIDVAKATSHGLSLATINTTLAAAWGSSYIDDFIDRGRVKRVFVQADPAYRMNPEDFNLWSAKNDKGEMVPFSAFASTRWDYGSPRLERYNGVSAMEVQGEAAPGVASGDAMLEIEKLAKQLPPGFSVEWTALSYQEREAGNQTPLLYTLSLLIVFLCLAALYESWSVPTAVLMVAPLGILGAVLANTLRGFERDIYFQVAMLTTVGLTSKNAILIVEFAKEHLEKGAGVIEATMHAVRDRLRPIVMTSLAFGLGVLPLAKATGAGSGAQRAIGTGVLGGMIAGTLLGLFFIPLFFVVVQRVFNRKNKIKIQEQADG
jgi:multidrug efflux pump